MTDSDDYPEEEYLQDLADGRLDFAWILENVGNYSAETAKAEALERYPYQPPEDKYRWLIFHELPWHWAMLHLYGEGYWHTYPHLQEPSDEYKKFCGWQ